MERIGVVLAAGGERVVPWQTGVLAGLADAGLDLRGAHAIVGTSAGAFVAARLALGVDPRAAADRIVERGVPRFPAELAALAATALPRLLQIQAETPGPEGVIRVGRFALEAQTIPEEAHVAAATQRLPEIVGAWPQRLVGARPQRLVGAWPQRLRLMAVDAETGELVRLDRASGIAVGRGVAAARSLPGVLPPVTVGERRLIDAAVVSGTNATAVDGVDRALVITPASAAPAPGTVDAALEAGLAPERAALERAGVIVDVLRADAAARAAMGEQLYGIVDAAAAVARGRRAGRALAAQIRPSRAA